MSLCNSQADLITLVSSCQLGNLVSSFHHSGLNFFEEVLEVVIIKHLYNQSQLYKKVQHKQLSDFKDRSSR